MLKDITLTLVINAVFPTPESPTIITLSDLILELDKLFGYGKLTLLSSAQNSLFLVLLIKFRVNYVFK